MLKKFLMTAAIVAIPFVATANNLSPLNEMPAGVYKLEPSHASLTWRVMHLGLSNYTARFTKMDATINLDAADPTKSKLVATVEPASLETDYPKPEEKDFDAKLRGEEWFNTEKFPEIRFESTSIEKTGENTGLIHGNLTFLGVTKPLTLDAKYNGGYKLHPFSNQPVIGVSATATLKRSEWGFSTYVPMIGDEVQLLIETEFVKAE